MDDWDTLRDRAPNQTWRDAIDRFKAHGTQPTPAKLAFVAEAMTGSPPDEPPPSDEPPPTA